MKRVLFIISTLFFAGYSVTAQVRRPVLLNDSDYDVGKPLRFGFSLGINSMDFDIKNSVTLEDASGEQFQYFAEATHLVPGFTVNAISDLRLSENLHLRFLPGYVFGQRNLDFYISKDNKTEYESTMKIESNFIDLPLGLKYLSQRVSNVRPYLYFGVDPRIDLAAYKRIKTEKGIYLRLQKFNVYYEVGFGIDFFLTYFKFSTEIKFSSGMGSAISKDFAEDGKQYRDAIDVLRSNMLIISFHFE